MKPILFNTEMVRAILDGRKTQTRRVKRARPRYQPGDTLYVRETWAPKATIDSWLDGINLYIYRADYDKPVPWKWRPSIHMPREAARLFLLVNADRIERLQEITPEDIAAEGLPSYIIAPGHEHYGNVCGKNWLGFSWYEKYWDKLNARRGYPWDSNPWVEVITFERTEVAP